MKSGSAFANHFGAKVSLGGAGEGMFLVIARSSDSAPRVRARDGQVVVRLNGTKVLPGWRSGRPWRCSGPPRGISKVGGVQLDPKPRIDPKQICSKCALRL